MINILGGNICEEDGDDATGVGNDDAGDYTGSL